MKGVKTKNKEIGKKERQKKERKERTKEKELMS